MMLALSTAVSGSSLSELYIECMQSFGEFLLALSNRECRVIRLGQVQLSEILEEYGRTKVWGNQTNAELPARARGSLDDTLRHDDELKDLVQAILMRLRVLLNQGKSCSVSADSASDSDGEGERQSHRMPKVRLLVQQTLEQIRSLYDMSALLRRPTIADKYIRSVNSRLNIATPSNAGYLPMSIGLSRFDEAHIVEKMLQWRGLTKSARRIDFEVEGVAPIGQGLKKYLIDDIMWFCQRLAVANTRRREQFQYWADHPYDPRHDTTTNEAQLATRSLAQSHTEESENNLEPESRAPTLEPSIHVPREGPKSALSKQSFSTAAVSDIYDTKTNVRPRTVYAPTVAGQGRSNSVPDPPKIEIGTTFSCPYCGTTLESSEMQNRQSWKRHVFRDLRPYVCTFEDCQNAEKKCQRIFENITMNQFRLGHLAVHMEDIALFVLPNTNGEEQVEDSKASVDVAKQNSEGKITGTESEPSSLGYSVAGDDKQIPTDFAKLLISEEERYTSKFLSWRTDDDRESSPMKCLTETNNTNLGGDHPDTTALLVDLASACYGQVHIEAAERLHIQLEETSGVLDEDHPDPRVSIASLLWTYKSQGRWEEVERLQIQVVETVEPILGEDHPDTLAIIADLALTYTNQRRWAEAERLQVQVIKTRKRLLGEDHPDTVASMADLALTYTNQGRWEEAERLQVQVVEIRQQILSEDHPDTLASMVDLALTYTSQGRWEEAERLQVRVVETRKQVLSEDHPDTVASMADLAWTYTNQGRWEEAERLQVQVVETFREKLGENHPYTSRSIASLARIYIKQGRLEEAERL
ncbi:Tetratricopeptide-like helical [Penicillium coprophilum]|uniref:Tetratricopeptide-like helical n=1 Tax=Penicillium coprophilum TaxID=36646 RepID=UPI00239BDA3E|nr:Tetratricopeptide-like helical [Penicillium coprophilum]KAJ5173651.1 Tetratricopeptide-like helical [Penicillium coprophilum]